MPPSSWLKTAVIKSNIPKDTITQLFVDKLGGYEKGRSRAVLHASDITKPNFCPRYEAFLDKDGVTHGGGSYVDTALRVTFDLGNVVASKLIEDWADGKAWGNWHCRRCGDQRTFCTKPGMGCFKSQDCQWHYREVCFVHPATQVSGSVDVFFDVGTAKLQLTELKIMAADEFDKIIAPLPEHRIRTALYLKLAAESTYMFKDKINLHAGRVLYTSRGYGRKNEDHGGKILPFKEYVVERDDASVDALLNKAGQLTIFRSKTLMPSGICSTTQDPVAKKCSKCSECFSGMHPAQQPSLI